MTNDEKEAWQKEQAMRAAKRAVDMDALPPGHPIDILRRENAALAAILDAAENAPEKFSRLAGLRKHYAKTEALLMPGLYRYGVTGPSKAIWDADDEIKRELSALLSLCGAKKELPKERVTAFLARVRDVMNREEKVLFPLALRYFTDEEWKRAYFDIEELGLAFFAPEDVPNWDEGEAFVRETEDTDREKLLSEGKVELPTGTLTVGQLAGIFSLLPVDITFIDADNRLRFFVNEGRVFARPRSALGREAWDCHPPRLVPMIQKMLDDFRREIRSEMTVWQRIAGKPVCVRYMAVRDANGEYLGTVETVQDCTEIVRHFQKENEEHGND